MPNTGVYPFSAFSERIEAKTYSALLLPSHGRCPICRMSDPGTCTTVLDELPTDLLVKVLNLLSTSERARLSVICHGLRDVIKASWTSITMPCSNLAELHNQTQWLTTITDCRPQTLQSLHWQPKPISPAPAISRTSPLCSWDNQHRSSIQCSLRSS